MPPGLWLGIDLIILTQTFCRPRTQWKTHSVALKSKTGLHPRRKRWDCLLKQTHNMPWSTHPAGEIMDYLHMQLCLRKMNEEHLAEGGGGGYERKIWERFSHLASVTQTRGCAEESEEDVVLGGDTKKVRTVFTPYRFQLSCLFKMCLGVTRPGLRQVLSTSSSRLPQTEPVSPSAE